MKFHIQNEKKSSNNAEVEMTERCYRTCNSLDVKNSKKKIKNKKEMIQNTSIIFVCVCTVCVCVCVCCLLN